MKKIVFIFVLVFGLVVTNVFACTALYISKPELHIFARTFDWTDGDGYFAIRQKGIGGLARWIARDQQPTYWKAKYSSAVFEYRMLQGKDVLTAGGMNDHGLVAAALFCGDMEYEKPSDKPNVSTLAFAQYILDKYKSVQDFLDHFDDIRVAPYDDYILHYIICDPTGNAAIIEFVHNKMVIYTGRSLTLNVLGNNSYTESLEFIKDYKGFGGSKSMPRGFGPLSRFLYAAYYGKQYKKLSSRKQIIQSLFKTFDNKSVRQATKTPWPTLWSVVYDLDHKIIYYQKRSDLKITKVDLDKINLNKYHDSVYLGRLTEG